MARGRFRKTVKRFGSRAVNSYRASRKPSISVMDVLLAGAIYGAVRPTVSNMMPTFFSFGPVDSDNVILGGAGYFASKSNNKLIKSIGLVAMGTEAGIITNSVVSGAVSTKSNGLF